jgi:hypothetical protein
MISAVDSRDVSKPPPAHYSPESVEASRAVWEGIGRCMSPPLSISLLTFTDMQAKYDADKALHGTQLAFTILRPGRLTEEPAAGAQVGRTQMGTTSRELVAQTVWAVLDQPGSAGLTLDVLDGQGVLKDEVEKAVKERVDAWTG